MASRTLLATYDPDWQVRWERCHVALEASRAEQQADETAFDVDLDARFSRELDELHAAYHARFGTVEEYRDHFMALDAESARGLDVPLPHFPDGASLQEVDDLLSRFRADTHDARRERHRPLAANPPNVAAFTTPPQAGCERVIEDLCLPGSPEGRSVDCLMITEATAQDVHVCFVSRRDGGSIPNNIERLATDVFRERFAPRGRWQRARAAFGHCAVGTYRPASLHFYDYLPWNVSGTHFCLEEFCSVSLTWSTQGFVRPEWTRLCSTPVFVAETARRLRGQVRSNRPRILRDTTTLDEIVWI
jgi:hypothetical protein